MTIRGSNGYFGRAKFKGYLQDLPPEQTVGRRATGANCPIAVFLKHLIPEHEPNTISVTSYYIDYRINGHHHGHETPSWAEAFISHIDLGNASGSSVTAREALAALD